MHFSKARARLVPDARAISSSPCIVAIWAAGRGRGYIAFGQSPGANWRGAGEDRPCRLYSDGGRPHANLRGLVRVPPAIPEDMLDPVEIEGLARLVPEDLGQLVLNVLEAEVWLGHPWSAEVLGPSMTLTLLVKTGQTARSCHVTPPRTIVLA